MGDFVRPEEMQSKLTAPALKSLDTGDLDDLYIYPAERVIEEEFRLDLDTDGYPGHLSLMFGLAQNAHMVAAYQQDYKRAVYLLVNQMGMNPHGHASMSAGGSSVVFGGKMPRAVTSLMNRWGRPGRVFRA
ncbi:MAG: hypothetical protein JSW58_08330 [Candidatus Latescibacterota bacterium]|nr:MAG: hypothetical protein JSW58_08330 [Candidatus Latescibacterota bacterium]